jgi:uncharacterized damage-inducible protein DinB
MTTVRRTLLEALPGFRSETVARFLWQMDAQRRSLIADTRGLSAADLAWQPAPGMNTIGMLLAHIAYSESHMTQIGLEFKATSDTRAVIGIDDTEEGMPLPEGAPPSAALAGRELPWFDAMLERARAETHRVAKTLTEADLDRVIRRTPPDGTIREFNVAWVLYHLLEHEAGHRAQVGVLRHLLKTVAATGR